MFNKFFVIALILIFRSTATAVPNNMEIRVSDLSLENRYEILLAYMTDAILTKSTEKELEGLKWYVNHRDSLIADSSSFGQFFREKDNYWTGNGWNLASYLLKDSGLLSLDTLYSHVKHESTELEQIWLPRIVNSIIKELESSKMHSSADTISSTSPKKKEKRRSSAPTWITIGLLMLLTIGLLFYLIAAWSRKMKRVNKSSKSRKLKHSIVKPRSNTPVRGFEIEPRGKFMQVEPKENTKQNGDNNSVKSNVSNIVEGENPSPTVTLSVNEGFNKAEYIGDEKRPLAEKTSDLIPEKFFGTPREDASFYMKDALTKGDRLILYRAEGNNSGKIFLDINSTHGKIIESRNRLIEPICESVNAFEIGKHTQIVLVESGDFLLEGDKLRVVKKVKIKYS